MGARLGLAAGVGLSVAGIRWVVGDGRSVDVALAILVSAFALMWCGYMVSRARMILLVSGFFVFLNGVFSTYSHWLPQVDRPPSYAFGALGGDRASSAATDGPGAADNLLRSGDGG
jgi:hypothetical protein